MILSEFSRIMDHIICVSTNVVDLDLSSLFTQTGTYELKIVVTSEHNNNKNMASMNPKSPTRFVMTATPTASQVAPNTRQKPSCVVQRN